MKKLFCYLFVFLISNTLLFGISTSQDSNKIIGKIILNNARDLRELPNYDEKKVFKKAGYFTRENFIGGTLRINQNVETPLITETPIDLAITEKVYNALNFCNFEVLGSSSNNKALILDININKLFAELSSSNLSLVFEIIINLKSSNKQLFLEKTFFYTDFYNEYSNVSFSSPENILRYLSNILYNQLIIFFQSEAFLEAYYGRKKMFKEYFHLLPSNFKDLIDEIPEPVPLDINCMSLTGILLNNKKSKLINNFKDLIELNISNTLISKIERFDNLTDLEYLICNRCQYLNNIDNLSMLKNLTYLTLDDNYKIKNYKSINSLTKLKYFSLHNNFIKKIANITNLNDLIKINLSINKIRKIENLENLNKLLSLNLYSNIIKKIENLDKLINLIELDLSYNKINKIENIEMLNNLRELDLAGNSIEKIENLNRLVNLKVLYLGGNKIKKIENLEDLINLEKLYIGYNWQISKIENINSLIKLKVLDLSGTSIEKIENINNLINLEELYLSRTKIKELKNLENLTKLKKLDISKTKIKTLKGIENFPNLEVLDITESKIDRLESLEKCPKLRRIKAEDIQIDEITKASYEFLKQRDWKFFENLTLDEWIKKYLIKIVE